ncbi:ATP-dependent endonuclease [Acholeplasma oculi]|uniref:ATP-dependent endonuclease n=1 Tax=Acholeplasma oculi TaxID=35623 RepID=UPI0031BA26E8
MKDNVSIKSLETFITENQNFEIFLRKYFKLNTADLFFADKAVLYEGSAERILFPAFIEKYDMKNKSNISNQHIALFEVGGRYAHVFYKLLEYLNLKTLVIADIDSINDKTRVTCNIIDDISTSKKRIKTSNGVIKSWFEMIGKDLYVLDLITKSKESFISTNGEKSMKLTTQLPKEPNYHCGRTLEEEMIIKNAIKIVEDINKKITDEKFDNKFKIIKNIIDKSEKIDSKFLIDNAFNIVEKIDKMGFALELIENLDIWDLPEYIEEGLKWLEN